MPSDPRDALYANNYASFTTSNGQVGPAGPVRVKKVYITTTLTGAVTLNDGTSSGAPVLFSTASAATAGTVYEVGLRFKNGCFAVAGSGGAFVVTFE